MKKIFLILVIIITIISATIPINALGSPVTDGALAPPPTPNDSALTASFSIMRSYADVTTVFVDNTVISSSAEVDGNFVSYYPTVLYSTPNSLVAPNSDGFGNITNYYSTNYIGTDIYITDLDGSQHAISYPDAPNLQKYSTVGNAYIYRSILAFATKDVSYQFGTVTGEWINNSDTDSIVSGYSIYFSGANMSGYTVSVTGTLSYGTEGHIVDTVSIDRSYTVARRTSFSFDPQTLLDYDDTINYDYYIFTGNWRVSCQTAGDIIEYKAFDFVNVETFDYIGGYNEYTDQVYSYELNPITRIVSNLSTTGQLPTGTLTVNTAGTHNVSGYEYIDVDIPAYTLYYNGDITNGTYENSTTWNGVDISILMDIGNTFDRGKITTVTENGDFNIGTSEYVNVEVPQEVMEDVNAFNWLFGAVNGFLQMEILPDFSLGGILLFIAGLALLIWILKIFLGG